MTENKNKFGKQMIQRKKKEKHGKSRTCISVL